MPRKAKVPYDQKANIAKDLDLIARTLKQQRAHLGWTQEQLAERMENCEVTTIQAYEQRRRTPSLPTLLMLCRVMRLKLFIE